MKIFETVFDGGDLVLSNMNLPANQHDDSQFDAVAKGMDFIPRLQFMSSASEKCKSGEFPINHYAVVAGSDSFEDAGSELDVLVVDWRPKALDMSGDEVIAIYDQKLDENNNPTGEFADIAARSDEPNSMCMFGPEFLLYIPSMKKFVTFFMGSKSSRIESPNLKKQMHKAATLKSQHIKTSKHQWFAPKITPCSTPLDPPQEAETLTTIDKFRNPPKPSSEAASDEEVESTERAR